MYHLTNDKRQLRAGTMKLVISYNGDTGQWEVIAENDTHVLWAGDLRREAFFYCRDREDDPADPVTDIAIFDREGNITYGFLEGDTPQ